MTKSSGGGMSGGRIAGIGMMAGGAVVAGLGVVFGVMADSSRKRIENAATNAQGQVTGITQKEAYQLDASVRTNATLANVMYGVGGALVAGGLVLFLVSGGPSSSSVAVAPAGTGVAVFALFTLGTLGPDLASRTGRTLRAFIALGSSGTLRTGRSDRARGSLCAERGGSRHGSEEENQDRPGDDRSITLHEYLHREPT